MKEIKVSVNTWYVVEGTAGATVINPSTNKAIATVEEGKQTAFYATTPYVLVSDDSVNVFKATFNLAPAKLRLLGLLGGGASTGSALPAGYLAAEFLEATGTQYIKATALFNNNTKLEMLARRTGSSVNSSFFGTEHYATANVATNRFCWLVDSEGKARFDYGPSSFYSNFVIEQGVCYKITKDAEKNCIDGVLVASNTPVVFNGIYGVIFARGAGPSYMGAVGGLKCAIYWCNIFNAGKPEHAFVPALTEKGVPCMYDKVSKQECRNSGLGQFIVGMTLSQARNLGKLPASGGSLTISLPTGYDSDSGVDAALKAAAAKGWNITERTHDAEASAVATFGMRRIWVRRNQNDFGSYVDADGKRWQVDWCVGMHNHDGSEPDAHGYELYRSVDAAVSYWELEPYVDSEQEELLTDYNENEQ